MTAPLRPGVVTTERLTLRPFTAQDVDDVWAYQRKPEVSQHMLWQPRDLAHVRETVAEMAGETELADEGDRLTFAVIWRETDRLVGQVELVWRSVEHSFGEVGYVFNPDYRGRGLATEAAREMLRLGFDELRLHRVVGRCSAKNTASAKLLERLGMRREGQFIGHAFVKRGWRDQLVFAMLHDEWRALSG